MKRYSWIFPWLVLYVAMVAAIVVGMRRYRESAVTHYSTMEAQQDWSQWRADTGRLNNEGPVTRREPKSESPPALVLMSDYFGVCLAISLLLSSLLFLTLMFAVHGALGGTVAEPDLSRWEDSADDRRGETLEDE